MRYVLHKKFKEEKIMFFGGNSNNNSNEVSTNTTVNSFYSNLSQLTIGAWNDKINVRFNPSIGKDGNGLAQYDRDKKLSTAIAQANAVSLIKMIDDKIIPVISSEEKEEISVSISMGNNTSKNVLTVSYKPDEDGVYSVFLTLCKGVSDQGIADESNTISYKFNKTETMVNYKPETGSGESYSVEGEFILFCDILRNHTDILPLTAHSIRHSDAIGRKYRSNNKSNQNGNSMSDMMGGYTPDFMEEGLPFN